MLTPEERGILEIQLDVIEMWAQDVPSGYEAVGTALIVATCRARAILNVDKNAALAVPADADDSRAWRNFWRIRKMVAAYKAERKPTRWQRFVRWLLARQKPVVDLGLRRCGCCGGVYEGPDGEVSCPPCQASDRTAVYLAGGRHHDT